MHKSIKRSVWVRVAAALASTLLFSFMTTFNIYRIQGCANDSTQAAALLDQAQRAETAHYKWSANLSNALYAGTEFTGSTDHTSCVLGQWLYGEAGTDDQEVLSLREEVEPLHKELHSSATYVLELMQEDPGAAQAYYQDTIQSNLATLVGLLDQVVERGSALSAESQQELENTMFMMHMTALVCLVLALSCLVSLVLYVLHNVVQPIMHITQSSRPLQEGRLDFELDYQSQNELGDLAKTLRDSMSLIHSYVTDINRIMSELSQGNFDVNTASAYIGDFHTIETSIDSLTATLSMTLAQISQAEQHISGNADQLSSSSQSLAQGATEQASSVEEMHATLDEISRSAGENVRTAETAQEHARLTGEQVSASGELMEEMVSAMEQINDTSQQIGQIISTIENIAFQTNILALNAAVEAARAGSAGKGFAVVADEVRSLAAQSDQAAKATKDLIGNSVEATKQGSRIVGEVSEALQKTMELVDRSNKDIGTIADAVRGEAESIRQVTDGVGQISSVIQMNSASSQESAAVSSELFDQVRLLQEQTRKFQLKRQ